MSKEDPFVISDINILHQFIEENNFGSLITHEQDEPIISHLPMLLEKNKNHYGSLIGHMAVNNPQYCASTKIWPATVIFSGPNGYISPAWYPPGFHVPTWNYMAVHVRGEMVFFEDAKLLQKLLDQMIDKHERALHSDWQIDWADVGAQNMLNSIVGFEIKITKIEGKFKLSQNHSLNKIQSVVNYLDLFSDQTYRQLASLMKKHNGI